MYRRAQMLVIGNAIVMGVVAIVLAVVTDNRLMDPEGSFLGPSWMRLPLLLGAAIGIDLIPRTLWRSGFKLDRMKENFRSRVKEHWTRERLTLVATGIIGFYIVYVCYRNIKSFLPDVMPDGYEFDRELHLIDRAIMFGHEPAHVLHDIFGTSIMAWVLSGIYLWFLPLVPIAVTIWVVWSRNLAYGYWFVAAQCVAWTLGTAAYYCLPTLGPGLAYPSLFTDLPFTPTSDLIESLVSTRQRVLLSDHDGVQSVAAFASLHTGITLLVALMVQHTIHNRVVRIVFWVNFSFTVVATLYFGWHYIADDIGGVAIALVAFYLGGLASGQTFKRKGVRDLGQESRDIQEREAERSHELGRSRV